MNYAKYDFPTPTTTTDHDFGTVDDKGRRIGARVVTYEGYFTPEKTGWCYSGDYPASGVAYFVQVSATRASARFGASHAPRIFASAAEREAHIARYLAWARKRAEKR